MMIKRLINTIKFICIVVLCVYLVVFNYYFANQGVDEDLTEFYFLNLRENIKIYEY